MYSMMATARQFGREQEKYNWVTGKLSTQRLMFVSRSSQALPEYSPAKSTPYLDKFNSR